MKSIKNYSVLIISILNYLNDNNTDDHYYFCEVSKDIDESNKMVSGIITKERPVSEITLDNLIKLENGITYEEQQNAKNYLLENNVICCYFRHGQEYWNCSVDSKIELDQAFYYFRCIDKDLLNTIIKNEKELILTHRYRNY